MELEKSSRFITNKFTSNLRIYALLLMMRNITLVEKFDEKCVHGPTIWNRGKYKCGAVVEYWVGDSEVLGLSSACVDKFSAGMVR
jgi:hypothetical protein